MIRVLIVDDHPAVRSGLVRAFRSEPGLLPVATASSATDALDRVRQVQPDVALLDYQLGDDDGLVLCHALKRSSSPPAVLLYSAFARQGLALAASVAGADGLLDKGAPLEDLFAAIRTVARGGNTLPAPPREAIERIVPRLDPSHVSILAMRTNGMTPDQIAAVLRLEEQELSRRLAALLRQLAQPPRAATGGEGHVPARCPPAAPGGTGPCAHGPGPER
jgi:DNA-binding NarL/FixJ family response regulator